MILSTVAFAMSAEEYTMPRYNITFDAPPGGRITYSAINRSEVMWHDMALIINIYGKKDTTDDMIRRNLYRTANQYNMYDTQLTKLKVKGFKTFTLEGTMPDGSRALMCNLVSPKNDLIISVMINYLFGNREDVEHIVKSFAEGRHAAHEEKKQKVQSEEDARKEKEKLNKEKELKSLAKKGELFEI